MESTVTTKTNTSLSIPWKTRITLSLLSAMTDTTCRSDGTVNRRLLNFLDFKSPANPKPIKNVKTADVTVDPSRKLWFRVFTPTDRHTESSLPVILFFHGGGFVFLSADAVAYDAVCRRFARKIQAVVVSVNYRLAPEHRYPCQYEDGFDVLKFLDDEENCRNYLPDFADLSRCFVAGDSAGGNLSHHIALRACEFKFTRLKVIGQVAIQPFFGGKERTEAESRLEGTPLVSVKRTDWMWKAFLPAGEELDRDHQCINVSGPKAVDISAKEFPATLVVVGGFDALQDWQRRYYQWLKKSGKEAYLSEYSNMFHAFYIFPELPESAILISEMTEFIHKCSKDESQHPFLALHNA